jgi:hypothetical protein
VTETLRNGKVVSISAGSARRARGSRTVTVGSANFRLTPGHSKTARVRLNGAGKRLLTARHKLAAELTLSAGGNPVFRQVIRFR